MKTIRSDKLYQLLMPNSFDNLELSLAKPKLIDIDSVFIKLYDFLIQERRQPIEFDCKFDGEQILIKVFEPLWNFVVISVHKFQTKETEDFFFQLGNHDTRETVYVGSLRVTKSNKIISSLTDNMKFVPSAFVNVICCETKGVTAEHSLKIELKELRTKKGMDLVRSHLNYCNGIIGKNINIHLQYNW